MSKLDFNKNMSRYLSARRRWRPSYSSPLAKLSLSRSKIVLNDAGNLQEVKSELEVKRRFREWYQDHFSRQKQTQVVEEISFEEPVTDDFDADFAVDDVPEVEPVQQRGPGLWARFSSYFSRQEHAAPSREQIDEVFSDDVKGDLKDVAQHFVGIVEKLSHRQREVVKQTHEFEAIKDVFRKHNIIK